MLAEAVKAIDGMCDALYEGIDDFLVAFGDVVESFSDYLEHWVPR